MKIKRIKLKTVTLIAFLLFLNFLYSGCIQERSLDDEVIIAIGSDISGYYPFINRDITSLSVNQNFFNPLVEIDNKTTGIIPALAKSWVNLDNNSWRFYLQENVVFHDGSRFTADDVLYTIEYLQNISYWIESLSTITDITILDEHTIELTTSEPRPLLLYDLINVNILSSSYMETIDNFDEYQPIGTGPYILTNHIHNKSITLERFDDYWGEKSNIKRAIFIIDESYDHRIEAIKNNEIDLTSIPFAYTDLFDNVSNVSIASVQTPSVYYIGFDFRLNDSVGFPIGKNPITDRRVREAIYRCINPTDLIEKKGNLYSGTIASQFVTAHTYGYNPEIQRLSINISLAKTLMFEAGYEEGFSIVMDAPDTTSVRTVIEYFVDRLSEINITIIPNYLEYSDYLLKLYLKNTSIYFAGFSPLTAEDTIRLMIHSSDMDQGYGLWNYGNYSNTHVDHLYHLIKNEMDTQTRHQYVMESFELAMNDIAWIPLYSPKAFYAVNEAIDWTPRHSAYILIKDISINQH